MPADFDVTYADGRKFVLLKADLAKGWRRLTKTYGFSRQMWIYYPGDFKVRTALTLLASPATFDESAAEFPEVSLQRGTELTSYQIEEKKLVMRVALHQDQPWRLIMGKRPGIYFEDLGLSIHPSIQQPASFHIEEKPWFWLDLRVLLVFHPPTRAPIPDVRVWCQKMFVPGGQFESNRRYH